MTMEALSASHMANFAPGAPEETPRKTHSRRESSGHLCTACDQCYRCKVRCSGERPTCERCQTNKSACTYSTGKPLGKPKGSKNKVQRRKTAPQLPRTNSLQVDQNLLPSPPQSITRPDDGPGPQLKRSLSEEQYTGYGLGLDFTFPAPNNDAPNLQDLPSGVHSDDLLSTGESIAYYGTTSNQEHGLPAVLEQSASGKFHNGFSSADMNLEMNDFKWYASPSESFATATPTPSLKISTHSTSVSVDSSSYQSYLPLRMGMPPGVLMPSPQDSIDTKVYNQQSCLCDPLGLRIISELHNLQVSLSPLDTTLQLARRGLSTISSYLTCPSCSSHLSTSPSLFLACVLILQQVFACYITLRMQGTRILASRKRADSPIADSPICIGDFEIEDDESCGALLDTIVRSEIERGKGIIGSLEHYIGRVGGEKQRMAAILLQSLREEISVVC